MTPVPVTHRMRHGAVRRPSVKACEWLWENSQAGWAHSGVGRCDTGRTAWATAAVPGMPRHSHTPRQNHTPEQKGELR